MVVSTFKPDVAAPRVVDEITVELARKHSREASVKLANADFVVEAASRYLGWADRNHHKKVRSPTHALPEHVLKGRLSGDLTRSQVCARTRRGYQQKIAPHTAVHMYSESRAVPRGSLVRGRSYFFMTVRCGMPYDIVARYSSRMRDDLLRLAVHCWCTGTTQLGE